MNRWRWLIYVPFLPNRWLFEVRVLDIRKICVLENRVFMLSVGRNLLWLFEFLRDIFCLMMSFFIKATIIAFFFLNNWSVYRFIFILFSFIVISSSLINAFINNILSLKHRFRIFQETTLLKLSISLNFSPMAFSTTSYPSTMYLRFIVFGSNTLLSFRW